MSESSTPQERRLKVAKVLDPFTIVLNKGGRDGVKVGQRVLVYSIGEEIFDPDTKESLGRLEVVKGTGKVSHVQPQMATVASDMKAPAGRTIRGAPGGLSAIALGIQGREEEVLPPTPVEFESVVPGDLVRPV